MLSEVISHRALVRELVKRDLRSRYVGSVLGLAWHVLFPILMIAIYAVVFGTIMGLKWGGMEKYGKLGFVLYLVSALLPWLTFQEVLQRSTRIYVEHSNLLRKVHFPEQVLNMQVVLAGMVSFAVALGVWVMFTCFVRPPTPWLLLLPALMLVQMVLMVGLSLFLATMNIFFRDIGPMVTILLMLWFWMTPIVYDAAIVPRAFRALIRLNPAYYMVEPYRSVISRGEAPNPLHLVVFVACALAAFLFGRWVFGRLKYDIADVV